MRQKNFCHSNVKHPILDDFPGLYNKKPALKFSATSDAG